MKTVLEINNSVLNKGQVLRQKPTVVIPPGKLVGLGSAAAVDSFQPWWLPQLCELSFTFVVMQFRSLCLKVFRVSRVVLIGRYCGSVVTVEVLRTLAHGIKL
uniref:Uncharacterized protein n=1 Tax=Steinernema glaseri TaxID=37863 RepID=A0A1I7YTY4_9BILA